MTRNEPCCWPLAHCGEAGAEACSALNALNPEMRVLIERMAVAYLWNWTGRKYGLCEVSVRPCREACVEAWGTYRGYGWQSTNLPWFGAGGGGPLNPALIGGTWWNLGCGGCSKDPCSCSYVPTVPLPGPVDSIVEVRIDGAVLDPAAYRVDNFRELVRVDGSDWPACQNMTADPATDPDTFEVTFNYGTPVPAGGQVAAGLLACELAKAACGASGCRLPQRLQSITRQGVTMNVLDSFETLYSQGSTGLWLVDSWVASENTPKRGRIRVASPDYRGYRRTTS